MGRLAFWIVVFAMAAFLAAEGATVFPLHEADALWFLPAPVQFAGGAPLLVNHLHYQAYRFDPTGAERMLFYPPGLPWLLGLLAPEPTPKGVYFILSLFCSAATLLTGLVYDEQVRRRRAAAPGAPLVGYGLGAAGIVALGTYFQGMAFGRPDFLATLLALLGWWVLDGLKGWERWVWIGLLLGAMAFTQTVAALFACALLGMAASLRAPTREVAAEMLPACAVGVAFLAILFDLNPNGFLAMAGGIGRHAAATMVEGNGAPFAKYFLFHSYAFGYGLLLLLALGLAAGAVAARWRAGEVRSRAAFLAFLAALLLLAGHFVGQYWNRLYNVWTFSPFLLLLVQGCGTEALRRAPPRGRRLLVAAAAATLGIGTLGFVHNAALFAFYRSDDAGSFLAARKKAAELLAARPPGAIGVSKSLWVFFNDYRGVRSFVSDPGELKAPARYLFVQQRYRESGDLRTPPDEPGYRRVWDDFAPEQARLFGIPLSPTWPAYRFAFYERIEWPPALTPIAGK